MFQEFVDFLVKNYFMIVYGVTLIISMLLYRKYFDTELKYFPILIAYTFFNELLGYFIRYTDGFSFFSEKEYLTANDLIYNIYDVVFYTFFFFVFWKLIRSTDGKKWILIVSLISLSSYIISLFFQNPMQVLLYWASAISSWMLLICSIIYLKELRTSWDWNLQKHNLMFWVTVGLTLFYLFFPFIILIGFLNIELWQKLHLRTVLRVLIVIMYGLFIIGFLWGRRKAFR